MFLFSSLLFASCDEGRIPEKTFTYNEKGRVAKLVADISNTDGWTSSGYTVAFAGFTEDGSFSEISKDIKPDGNGHVSMTLAGIPENVTKLEVCVINSIRKRVLTYYTTEAATTSDTIIVKPTEAINTDLFDYLQANIFDKQCMHCHSGSEWAASLNLNNGKSYAQLVNVASAKVDGKNRVTPKDANNSILYEVLSSELSTGWKYDHSKIMVTDAANLKLIKDWINGGAKN